jgi:hypothetical protein
MAANNFAAAVLPSVIIATASATNAVCTATATAPPAGFKWVVTGFDISASGAPAAAVAATYTNGASTMATMQLPASAFAMIGRNFPDGGVEVAVATACAVSVPALGAAIVCSVNVYGRLVQVA